MESSSIISPQLRDFCQLASIPVKESSSPATLRAQLCAALVNDLDIALLESLVAKADYGADTFDTDLWSLVLNSKNCKSRGPFVINLVLEAPLSLSKRLLHPDGRFYQLLTEDTKNSRIWNGEPYTTQCRALMAAPTV